MAVFRPGFVTNSQAKSLTESSRAVEAHAHKLTQLPTVEDFFPASITSGSSGLHAWTEQAFDADGVRYTKPDGRTGTATWMPARMPDGSTLETFPREVWMRRAVVSDTYGPVYEILIGEGVAEGIAAADLIGDPVAIYEGAVGGGIVSTPENSWYQLWSTTLSTGLYAVSGQIRTLASGTVTDYPTSDLSLFYAGRFIATGGTLYPDQVNSTHIISINNTSIPTTSFANRTATTGGTAFPFVLFDVTDTTGTLSYEVFFSVVEVGGTAVIFLDGILVEHTAFWRLKLKA